MVFHAAAYKHVPIVEENPLQGIINNVISTAVVCNASYKSNVENFCLISTDKAVRPTNVMGASKRLSELLVQSYAHLESSQEKDDNFLFFKINIEKFQHSTKFWNLPPESSNLFDEESNPTRFANPVIELSDND